MLYENERRIYLIMILINIGNRFGKLTVIKYNKSSTGGRLYECKCDCGKVALVTASKLKTGWTKSCGCLSVHNKKGNNFAWKGYGEISKRYFDSLKIGAERRNIQFDITIRQMWDLFLKQNRKCALTGYELKFNSHSRISDGTASLDRIDSSKCYTVENIQWVHKDINYMKSDYDQNYFLKLIKDICDYRKDANV
jgi:hypothetical protein